MWGEEKARGMLREAGVTKVEVEQPLYDFANHYFIITKN
jgi:Zn-dependent membrane protease YugP